MSNHPNMLFQHSEATFILPKRPIWTDKLQKIISKANIGLEGQKNEGKGHNSLQQDESIYKNQIILFYKISSVSLVFWSSRPILAFGMIVCNLSIQIGHLGSIKVASECWKSMFGWFDIQMCKFLVIAIRVAFLAFSALKL